MSRAAGTPLRTGLPYPEGTPPRGRRHRGRHWTTGIASSKSGLSRCPPNVIVPAVSPRTIALRYRNKTTGISEPPRRARLTDRGQFATLCHSLAKRP